MTRRRTRLIVLLCSLLAGVALSAAPAAAPTAARYKAAQIVQPLHAEAAPMPQIGPSGLLICNSINTSPGVRITPWYRDNIGNGYHEYATLYPGQCAEGYNGTGLLRVRFSTVTSSFFMKQYINGHVSGCNTSPVPGTYYNWDPPNDNGYRIDVDGSTGPNCG